MVLQGQQVEDAGDLRSNTRRERRSERSDELVDRLRYGATSRADFRLVQRNPVVDQQIRECLIGSTGVQRSRTEETLRFARILSGAGRGWRRAGAGRVARGSTRTLLRQS